MLVLDYANAGKAGRAPLWGRISASCILVFVATYALALCIGGKGEFWLESVTYTLFFISLCGAITSLIAVIRPPSRTRLAWLSFGIWTAWWAFYLLAFLAGM
jgi:hypothetical protein